MKKILLSLTAVTAFLTTANAELVTFEYDFMPVSIGSSNTTANSQSFTLGFKVDDNLRAGIMQESMDLTLENGGVTGTGNVQISALNLEFKALEGFGDIKIPAILGVNIGSANLNAPVVAGAQSIGATTEMMSDLYVKTEYAAGKYSFISGKLGYRMLPMAETTGAFDNVNGMFMKIGVGVRF